MPRPIVELTVDGQPMAAAFYSRLVRLEVVDNEADKADTFSAELEDGPAGALAIPRRGAQVKIWMGYAETGVRYMGAFTVDEVEAACLPYTMRISGKSASMRGGLKQPKERHWDGKTIRQIAGKIAAENGLQPKVDSKIGSRKYEWLGQQDESDLHFLRRIVARHGGMVVIKDEKLIIAPRGAGKSAGGQALTTLVITPPMIVPGSCRVKFVDRPRYKAVIAYWQDRAAAKRRQVRVQSDPKAKAVLKLREPFASEDEAKAAARARAKETRRAADSASVVIEGNIAAMAGAPMTFAGVRAGVDGVEFVQKTVRHSFAKGDGYRTSIEAKAKAT